MSRRTSSYLALAALLAAIVPLSPAEAAKTCFGRSATIVATHTDPRAPGYLVGTRGDDVIVGRRGWDEIDGGGGDDLICAGGGDDRIVAGPGDDKVRGQGGMDTLLGNGGRDRLWGGGGPADSLLGGAGNDRLLGGRGHQDSLVGGPGNDEMDGGKGYDLAEFWDSPRGVTADLRNDTAVGNGHDVIAWVEGLIGSSHDDTLFGDELSNMIRGGSGNDHIEAFDSTDGSFDLMRSDGGIDTLDGGAGPDVVSYNLSPFSVDADLVAGEAISAEGFGEDTLIAVEHLVGSKYDDTLMGADDANTIVPSGGNDVVDGRGGVDEIAFFDSRRAVRLDLGVGTAHAGDWGSDTLVNFEIVIGSTYADVLVGDEGPNEIWGEGRGDTLRGLGGDDVLVGGNGTDDADGGEGTDRCDAETATSCEADARGGRALLVGTALRAGAW